MLREHRGESMKHLTSKNFKGSFSYKVVRQFNHSIVNYSEQVLKGFMFYICIIIVFKKTCKYIHILVF